MRSRPSAPRLPSRARRRRVHLPRFSTFPGRSRIVGKLLVRYARLRRLAEEVFPLADLVMMRKHLLTLKMLAEGR